VWDRGEYQVAPAVDYGTLKCKMGFAPVFGAPDGIETADQIKIQGVSVRPTRNANRPPPEELAWISTCQRSVSGNPDILNQSR
jgi:hypothetical protein